MKNVGADHQINQILQTSKIQCQIIIDEAKRVLKEHFDQKVQDLNLEFDEKQKNLATNEALLQENQILNLDGYTHKLNHQESTLIQISDEVSKNNRLCDECTVSVNKIKLQRETALQSRSLCQTSEIFSDIKNTYLQSQILDINRLSFERQEEIKRNAQKQAQKIISNVYYRYQPNFIWPKTAFSVSVTNKSFIEKYFLEPSQLQTLLLENTHSALTVVNAPVANQFFIKITGGLGVDKEIIRLTLEDCVDKKNLNLDKVTSVLQKHRANMEKQILALGREATEILELPHVHPEILKLIGSLNYRTSHRQNQYFHSFEVAILAGMIAQELGVDAHLAKRSGILHDIGKVLDYKIEGSHAVISGDYAAQFDEKSTVVDTILAHHDDKIVDTPHAFILKAADAMSGARPGARMDMEDGYHRRLDGISAVIHSFQDAGVVDSAIMHAGREVHVYVDNKKTRHSEIDTLAQNIVRKLESEVEYPGHIRVTVIRRMEVMEVA